MNLSPNLKGITWLTGQLCLSHCGLPRVPCATCFESLGTCVTLNSSNGDGVSSTGIWGNMNEHDRPGCWGRQQPLCQAWRLPGILWAQGFWTSLDPAFSKQSCILHSSEARHVAKETRKYLNTVSIIYTY